MLALSDLMALYLRNMPDGVVQRLQGLAKCDATSIGPAAVREPSEVSRRADNPALSGVLPDLGIDATTVVAELDRERAPCFPRF